MKTFNHPSGHQFALDFLNPIEDPGTTRSFSTPNDIYFLPRDIATKVTFTPDFSFDNESGQQINISNILVGDTVVGSEHTVTFNKNAISITQEPSVHFYLFIPEMTLDDKFSFKGKEAEDRDWGTPIRFDNLKDLIGFYLENEQEIKSARKEYDIREERREIGTKFYKENNNNVLLFPLDNERYAIYPFHQTGRIEAEGVINESGVTYINKLTDDIKEKLNQEFGGFSIYQMNNVKETDNIPLTPPLPSPNSPIFDFGEKFGGAKKDYYSVFQHFGKYSNQELITSPLSQTLPHPNYKDLSKDGIASPTEIATLRYLRDKLNPKPSPTRPKFIINRWLESVDLYKNYYKSLYMDDYFEMNGHPYSDVIFQSLPSSERENIEHFAKTILALGFPEKNVNLSGYEIKSFNGKDFAICSNNLIMEKNLSWEQAVESLNKLIEKKEKTFKIDFFKSKAYQTIFIGKRLPLQDIILADGFITIEDAAKYAKENLKQLEEKFNSMKLDPKERRENNRERVGEDYRNGKNISPETFCQTFDFKGVEFGNWVQNKERQTSLNKAYDSFMDLAHVTNIPTQAISLGGNLGIAFGSRGSGPNAAHYEPAKVVINLTKTHGAGSLAHEWWHALDNYFSRQRDKPFDYITENYRPLSPNSPAHIRSELINAFKDITNSIHNSDLRSRSFNLDRTRTKSYWSQTRELTARCFENWIVDKLESNHIQNDYLANFRTPEEWISNNLQTDRNYPYPTQTESEYINNNFQTLFDTIQTKLNNDNHTILFRESNDNTPNLAPFPSKEKLITEEELIINTAKQNGNYLKAPNGKPTNLSKEQWVQTRTTSFKEWFGDWEKDSNNASKILDENREPLVTLHGSRSAGFGEFEESSPGFYFTDNMEMAKVYANDIPIAYSPWSNNDNAIYHTFLSVKNPIVVDAQGREWSDLQFHVGGNVLTSAEEIIEYIRENRTGNDGVIIHNVEDGNDSRQQGSIFVSVSPNQIKDAYANNGEFSISDNDIRFNIIGEKGAQNNPAIQNSLDIAIAMEQSGKKPEEIFIATGWEKTNDNNQWKYDLHAEDIRFIAGISGTEHYGKKTFSDQLDRIIDFPALFECYPQMRTMDVHFEQSEDPSTTGYYQNGKIFIETTGRDALSQLSTLIHEIQHVIQEIEGFAKGGNIEMFEAEYNRKYRQMVFYADVGERYPKIEDIKSHYDKYKENYSFLNLEIVAKREGYNSIDEFISSFNNTPSKQYYNLAGEVEARNASSRLNLPERERSMTMMSYTEDVAEPNKIYSHNRNEITTEIEKLSKILNTPVEKVNTRQELPDFIQKIMKPDLLYAGLYDIKNDKVYTILNEIKDVKEAQSTMLHEILGHKGLLALFKNPQEENEFFQKVWDIIPPAERSRLSAKYKDQKIGAEEYMARFAENYKEPKVWEKIEAIIKTFFRKLGVDLQLTSVDLKNILHKAQQNLQQTKMQPVNQKMQSNAMNI